MAVCEETSCMTLPLSMFGAGGRMELGIRKGDNGEMTFGYDYEKSPTVIVGNEWAVELNERGVSGEEISVAGNGIAPLTNPESAITDEFLASRQALVPLLGALQMLTPQPDWAGAYSGQGVRGIEIGRLSQERRGKLLALLFGNARAENGANTVIKMDGVDNYILYSEGSGKKEIFIYQSRDGLPLQGKQFALPFMKRGISLNVPAGSCMNGVKEEGEECDLSNGELDNNPNCGQSTSRVIEGVRMSRDDKGKCTLSCRCSEDSFAVDEQEKGNECNLDNQCSAKTEKCAAGKCVPKTYCGDGVVQSVNDDQISEECEPGKDMYAKYGVSDIGQCRVGVSVCTSACKWSALIGMSLPDLVERDDGVDNNCDARLDEGISCSPGQERKCGFETGQCSLGIQRCDVLGTWGRCENEIKPSREICDNVDNNCNGIVDEGLRNGKGECIEGDKGAGEAIAPKIEQRGFILSRALASTGPYVPIALLPSTQKEFVDIGLMENTNYYYKVQAYNLLDVSGFSGMANAKTFERNSAENGGGNANEKRNTEDDNDNAKGNGNGNNNAVSEEIVTDKKERYFRFAIR